MAGLNRNKELLLRTELVRQVVAEHFLCRYKRIIILIIIYYSVGVYYYFWKGGV